MNNKFFEEPIINSPYEYPRRHWELVDGQPTQKITVSRALLVTRKKALDVISTYRFIGANGDSNPIAQWLFEKTGLAGSLRSVWFEYYLSVMPATKGFFHGQRRVYTITCAMSGIFEL